MQFNVAQLLKEPLGFQWDLAVNEEVVTERGEGQLLLTRFNQGIWAEAFLTLEVDEVCGRCLKGSRQPIHASINEQFRCAPATGRNGAPEPEDGDLFIDDAGTLDLSEVLRQHLILNRPVKSLCHPDCNGICSLCGGNGIDPTGASPGNSTLTPLDQSRERG